MNISIILVNYTINKPCPTKLIKIKLQKVYKHIKNWINKPIDNGILVNIYQLL